MLNITWNEIGLVAFLFLLVWAAGILPRLGTVLGDFLLGYRSAANQSAQGPTPEKDQAPNAEAKPRTQ